MSGRIIIGDALAEMQKLPSESVNVIITSPPYYGLRDYGVAGQYGTEKTLDAYIAKQVEVFREARRVLRKDGVCWVEIGDSYVNEPGGSQGAGGDRFSRTFTARTEFKKRGRDMKTKDLMLVPHTLAVALRADGWWLRADNVWHKPNPYPEAARDRTTRAHTFVFMFTRSATTKWWRHKETRAWARPKPPPDYRWIDRQTFGQERTAVEPPDWRTATFEYSGRTHKRWARLNAWEGFDYWYDADAIAEPTSPKTNPRGAGGRGKGAKATQIEIAEKDRQRLELGLRPGARMGHGNGWRQREDVARAANPWVSGGRRFLVARRNKRSVWTIPTRPYPGMHFATFPPELVVPCILSSCPIGGTVLDPYGGSGTVGQIAEDLGRNWILIELNENYAAQAADRVKQRTPYAQHELLRSHR